MCPFFVIAKAPSMHIPDEVGANSWTRSLGYIWWCAHLDGLQKGAACQLCSWDPKVAD